MKVRSEVMRAAQCVTEGVLAGILISLGGAVFLACCRIDAPYGKIVGALLFPLALVCICMRGYALYTGKIGLIYEKHSKDDLSLLFLCLLGNVIGTAACGFLLGWVLPELKETALSLCTGKLAQGYGFGFLRAVFCGLLVYLAVDVYRSNRSPLGIMLCIPAFILSGFEHSIADMFYFATSGIVTGEAFGYLMMIVLGNSVGGLLIPTLRLVKPSEKAEADAATSEEKSEKTEKTEETADPSESRK